MSDTITYKVGDSVFVTDDSISGEFVGTHGVIKTVDDVAGTDLPIFVEFHDTLTDRKRSFWVRKGHFNVAEPEEPGRHLSLPANMTLEEAHLIIERFENDYREVMGQRDSQEKRAVDAEGRLRTQQDRYSADMRSIERIMLETKEQQSWCDNGWNEVVDEVNAALVGGYEFDRMMKRKRMTKRVRGTVYRDVEVWVADDDDTDDDDADNWFQSEDGDDQFGELADILCNEFENNGFDDIEVQ
jgi:hypothetical protein